MLFTNILHDRFVDREDQMPRTVTFCCNVQNKLPCAALMFTWYPVINVSCLFTCGRCNCEMYHVLVRGYSGMMLPDTMVLDHLLEPFVETFGAQPETPLALQLLLSLEKQIWKCSQIHKSLQLLACAAGQWFHLSTAILSFTSRGQ